MSFKSLRLSLALLAVGVPGALAAQSTFEGVIVMSMASPRGNMEMSYLVKGERVRVDMAMGGMQSYMLRDNKGLNAMVMPERKMYVSMAGMEAMIPGGRAGQTKPADIKPTGRKETIAGYECEHILITSDDGAQYDVCGAKGLGTFQMSSNPMGRGGAGGPPPGLERLGAFFPMKVQKVGGEVAMQVTKIEKKSMDESLFTIPSDYQKMDMPMRGRPPR